MLFGCKHQGQAEIGDICDQRSELWYTPVWGKTITITIHYVHKQLLSWVTINNDNPNLECLTKWLILRENNWTR